MSIYFEPCRFSVMSGVRDASWNASCPTHRRKTVGIASRQQPAVLFLVYRKDFYDFAWVSETDHANTGAGDRDRQRQDA